MGREKIFKIVFIVLLALSFAALIAVIVAGEINKWPGASAIASFLLSFPPQIAYRLIQDLADNENWKKTQRKYERGHFINGDIPIRISFAYLFRIKIDGKYFLVKNARKTGQYQPVGGVYKMDDEEYWFLKGKFHIMDDDKINDSKTDNDYRLRVKNKYLRKFVKRFDTTNRRERIDNLSREFR